MKKSELKELSLIEQNQIHGGDLLGGIAAIAGSAILVFSSGVSLGRSIYKSLH